jgi:thioesterase domain-containing protein
VNDNHSLATQLERTWHREIPLAAAMRIGVAECADEALLVRAPLAENINVHGTAFAGSLYSVCVLTGWGTVWLALERHGLSGRIVVANASIRYRRAVTGEILCRCELDRAAQQRFAEQLAAEKRAALTLECWIDGDNGRAVAFNGDYVVHLGRE